MKARIFIIVFSSIYLLLIFLLAGILTSGTINIQKWSEMSKFLISTCWPLFTMIYTCVVLSWKKELIDEIMK